MKYFISFRKRDGRASTYVFFMISVTDLQNIKELDKLVFVTSRRL